MAIAVTLGASLLSVRYLFLVMFVIVPLVTLFGLIRRLVVPLRRFALFILFCYQGVEIPVFIGRIFC